MQTPLDPTLQPPMAPAAPQSPAAQVDAAQSAAGLDTGNSLEQLLALLATLGAGQGGGVLPLGGQQGFSTGNMAGYGALLRALGQGGFSTPALLDPAAQRQSLYPTYAPGNGPYVQWLGGSLQPQKHANVLAAATLINNLLSGWAQGRHEAQQPDLSQLPTGAQGTSGG